MLSEKDVISLLNEYLNEQTIFALATHSDKGSWMSTMFFGYNNGKLYFSSKTKTRHAQEIGKGSQVAFAIADSSQTPASKIIGLQGVGFCHPSGIVEISDVVTHYGVRFAEYNDTFGNLSALKDLVTGGLNLPYTIEISLIKFLYEEKFERGYQFIEFENGEVSKVYGP